MTRGANARQTARGRARFRIEERIAPHVDPLWAEQVLLELRLQGVGGSRIAGVLAEVESHVVESGESAASAFGEPVEYARSLALEPDPTQETKPGAVDVALAFGQVAGAVLLVGGGYALGARQPAPLTWGVLVTVLLATVVTGLVLRFGDQVLRVVVGSTWQFVLGAGAVVLVVPLPAVLIRTTLIEVGGAPMLAAGAALLLGAAVVELVRSAPDDPITSPFDVPADPSARATHRWSGIAGFVLLAATAAAAGLMFAVGRLT
ncbi:hypothetical protein KIN34_04130 [Cellulomonas sp. DKR-3]|uniref:Uncharacterized protein n=1 Tax=Cellulomonas fulva TaxID=2835530 RepID=A0ABS5TWD9_9CELL|nr:hypothetical protein [Cellulomonas fulva]MBT0993473.1 hypothetical protein [Cellulomonas fulva]